VIELASGATITGVPARGRVAVSWVAAASALLVAAFMLVALTAGLGATMTGAVAAERDDGATVPSSVARREIPPFYLRLYEEAGRRFGLDWAVLAGIGKVECDHGRDPDPSCGQEGRTNPAGAGGPMQFIGSTWMSYGVDGNGDGTADRWNPADAIFSAANYLHAAGAPRSYRSALYAYNHAWWYVAEVEKWAGRYRGAAHDLQASVADEGDPVGADGGLQAGTSTPVGFVAGERALLDPGDGHLALVPAGVPWTVQAMVVAGNELQGLEYGPGGHSDPRGSRQEDCSSTVNYVLYRSGVRPIAEITADNPLAQDYVHWGEPGPGRWVTIYATTRPTDHVFIVIAGLRLDTSHDGTDIGPNRSQGGPRWRILDHVPTWARWSVRHPVGL
jgi:Transglycosylase SLT domain